MKKYLRFFLCVLCTLLLLCSVACTSPDPMYPTDTSTESTTADTSLDTPEKGYYLFLKNSDYLTREDLTAISRIINSYTEHQVIVLDVKECTSAKEVYQLIQEVKSTQNGNPEGIQIFGTKDMVPAFLIDNKAKIGEDDYSTSNAFFTDYFYGNLENDAAEFQKFNVADNFASLEPLCLTPEFRVVRLTLGSGEFSNFVENYQRYLDELKGIQPQMVSMVSSIFRYSKTTAVDDVAYFLQRAKDEWGLLNSVHQYTNQRGMFLSPVNAMGDCSEKNIQKENAAGVAEFFFAGHGSQTELIRTVFEENGTETHSTLLSENAIPFLLSANPYYLNLHNCSTAEGLDHNFVRTALVNGCLGAFGGTTVLSNNGIDCKVPLEEMKNSSNFFAFHYFYLLSRHNGDTRSEAFFKAQRSYEEILRECRQKPIDYASNYQFGYWNLLSYSNFGIIEPDTDVLMAASDITDGATQIPIPIEHLFVTTGAPIKNEIPLSLTLYQEVTNQFVKIKSASATILDNGYVRFRFHVDPTVESKLLVLSTTGHYFQKHYFAWEESILVMDLPKEALIQQKDLALLFETDRLQIVWYVADFDEALAQAE